MADTEVGKGSVKITADTESLASDIDSKVKGQGGAISKIFGGMGKLAGAALIGGAGLAIAAGAGLAKLGESFDEAYDTIRITTGKTGDALSGLQADFRQVASTVPVDLGEAGDAVALLNQKLGDSGKPLQDISVQMLNLSRMTKTDLKGNIEAVAGTFNQWGVAVGDQSTKLDELYRISQQTGVSFQTLSQGLSSGGAQFRAAGLTFEQSGALIGLLAKNGLDAGAVIPALGKAMAVAAKEGKPAAEVFKDTFDKIKNAPNDIAGAQAAVEVFGAKAGPKFAELIRSGALGYDDFAKSIAAGGDTINDAASATDDWKEKLKLLTNKLAVDLAPVAAKVFDGITTAITFVTPYIESFAHWLSVEIPVAVGVMKGWIDQYVVPAFGAISVAAMAVGRFFRDTVYPIIHRVFEDIVGGVTWVVGWVSDHWSKISTIALGVATFFSGAVWPIIQKVFGAIVSGVTWVVNWMRDHWSQISKIAVSVFDAIKTAVLYFINVIVPDIIGGFKATFGWLMNNKEVLIGVAVGLGAAMVGLFITWSSAAEEAAVATTAATWPVLAIAAAIGAVVAGVLYAYNHFKTFHDIVDTVGRAIKTATGWLMDHKAVLVAVGITIAALVAPIPTVIAALIYCWTHFQTFRDVVLDVINVVRGIIEVFVAVITDLWSRFGDDIIAAARLAWDFISGIVQAAVEVIVGIFDFFRDLFTGKWGKLWGDVRDILAGVWDAVKVVIQSTIDAIVLIIQTAWDGLKLAAQLVWDAIKLIITGVWDAIKLAASIVWDGIKLAITTVWDGIKGAASLVWEAIKLAIMAPINAVEMLLSAAWDAIKSAAATAWDLIQKAVEAPVVLIQIAVQGMVDFFGGIWDGIEDAASRVWNSVKSIISGIIKDIGGVVSGLWSGIKSGAETAINALIGAANAVIRGINDVNPFSDIPPISPVHLHSGGPVPGTTGIPTPTMLLAGETVRTTSQESMLQAALLSASSGVSAGVGGGASFVYAPTIISPDHQVGKIVGDAIQQYQRFNGRLPWVTAGT